MIKKKQWWAITCEGFGDPEMVVGFSEALVFRTKELAQISFKENGYRARFKTADGEILKYRIRRVRF